MNVLAQNGGYRQSFNGLLGKDSTVKVDNYDTGVKFWHERTYYPFSKEPQQLIESTIERESGDIVYTIGSNGFGSQVHNTKVLLGNKLDITQGEYKAYRYYRANPETAQKVENSLVENGLNQYLNKGFSAKVRKAVSKILH